MEEMKSQVDFPIIFLPSLVIVVGNKMDTLNRVIMKEQGQKLAVNNLIKYFETRY